MPAPKPLYNLPAIFEAPTNRVIVVEGEKGRRCGGGRIP